MFWHLGLEINERPLKRPTLDLSKLSISDSGERGNSILSLDFCACMIMVWIQGSFSIFYVDIGPSVAEDVKPKKVLVRHLETVTDSETTADIIHSLFVSLLS